MKKTNQSNSHNREESVFILSYCRVSSRRQEEEGYSLDTQEKTIVSYAKNQGFMIEDNFRESYSASRSGRRGFDGMLETFKKSRAQRKIVLVGKVDRFTRNHEDALAVEKLGLEVHFVYEGMVISCQSSPGQLLLYDIQTAIATYQSRVTGADTKRNMRRKAEQGLWPSRAPFGYRNVTRNKVKLIVPDDKQASLYKLLHKEAREKDHTLSSLTREAIKLGFQFSTGGRVTASWIRKLMVNPIYSGEFEWAGEIYEGKHQPLISHSEYREVVKKLKIKHSTAASTRQADKYLYWGMLYCPQCMRSVCGETKKRTYVYYRCGANANARKCNHTYSQEKFINYYFSFALRKLEFSTESVSWLSDILNYQAEFDDAERRRSEASRTDQIRRLRLQQKKLLEGHLDGHVDDEMFVAKNRELSQSINALGNVEKNKETFNPSPGEILTLMKRLPKIFSQASDEKKRQFLELVFVRSPYSDGSVYPRFNKAFLVFDTRTEDPEKLVS